MTSSGIKIACIWVVALLVGWLLRTWLPANWFIFSTRTSVGYVYPLNRIAFWACLMLACIVTTAWVIRLCVLDLRIC